MLARASAPALTSSSTTSRRYTLGKAACSATFWVFSSCLLSLSNNDWIADQSLIAILFCTHQLIRLSSTAAAHRVQSLKVPGAHPDLVGGAPELLKAAIFGALHHTSCIIRVRVTAARQEPAGTPRAWQTVPAAETYGLTRPEPHLLAPLRAASLSEELEESELSEDSSSEVGSASSESEP